MRRRRPLSGAARSALGLGLVRVRIRLECGARGRSRARVSMLPCLRVIDIEEEQDGTAAMVDGGSNVAGDNTGVVVQSAHLVWASVRVRLRGRVRARIRLRLSGVVVQRAHRRPAAAIVCAGAHQQRGAPDAITARVTARLRLRLRDRARVGVS